MLDIDDGGLSGWYFSSPNLIDPARISLVRLGDYVHRSEQGAFLVTIENYSDLSVVIGVDMKPKALRHEYEAACPCSQRRVIAAGTFFDKTLWCVSSNDESVNDRVRGLAGIMGWPVLFVDRTEERAA